MSSNTITLVGNLVRDAEVRAAGDKKLTKLRVASNDRIKIGDEWKDGDATYTDVTAWRKLGQGAAALKRGDRVVVTGKLKGREYTNNEGTKIYAYEIDATDIGLSVLARGESEPAPFIPADVDSPW